jgi:large subunit ribosomal protein L6
MSRIGKKPVPVPKGVTITQDGAMITVKGPRGELKRTLPADMQVAVAGEEITVTRPSDEQRHKALHGLTRSLIANMVEGVTKGFTKQLDIIGVGYKAENRPFGLQMALGYSHPIEVRAPAGIKLNAPNPTTVVVEGADKEVVGQVAAEIRKLRPPEPYKGKGVKYQGEVVRRKAGKAGGK